jgi:cellulose synthase/poly-beta-1,6-N-acetylglucosamine synthase-like glycosyltransferase
VFDLHGNKDLVVDVIIPVYRERSEALAATLSACLNQTFPISRIFVVDDGSPEPVSLPRWAQYSPQTSLIRLPRNQGISAARNAAIVRSTAILLACINTEVLPDPDWLATCQNYLSLHPGVGACYTRVVPQRPERILTRWRMRFQEPRPENHSGPARFAHGHAVLFRKEAVDLVGGYDVRYRRHHEDWDICQRMRKAGWESHYIAQSRCISIQEDSLRSLAEKQLRDSGWYSPTESSLVRLYFHLSKWTLVRAGRNMLKGRLFFLPVDAAIWATALCVATVRTLRSTPTNESKRAPLTPDHPPASESAREPADPPAAKSSAE